MATPTLRHATLRQALRRIYPHQAIWYAREHLRGRTLGPIRLSDAADLLETFTYSLIPREAQSILRFLLGLNTELCKAGPVAKASHRERAASKRAHA